MKVKKGLILEGGAMRAIFTAGVLDVFIENDINFDGMIGVSAGATFGCNLKSKQADRTIRYNLKYINNKCYGSLRSLLKTGDYYDANFCYNLIPNKLDVFDTKTFKENPMEFYVVASDCNTGLPIYKELKNADEKDLTWMRASASMPLLSNIVSVDGYELLDGGMTDSIPLKKFEDMGYNKNVVVLTQPEDYVKKPSSFMWIMKIVLKKYPKLLAAMEKRHEVYNEERRDVFEKAKKGEVIVICPEEPLCVSRTEKNSEKLKTIYEEGRLAASKKISEIDHFLGDIYK